LLDKRAQKLVHLDDMRLESACSRVLSAGVEE
jgi:hypothetical protein